MKHGPTGESDGENDDGDTEDQSDIEEEAVEGEEDEVDAEEEIEIEQEADSFLINTPESMEDPEGDDVDVDFDMEIPDFYDDVNVDSKEGFTLEFVQKDLLALEDEDESVYISSQPNDTHLQQQQQQQVALQRPQQQLTFQQLQPMAKRARLDVNYSISPTTTNVSGLHTSTAAVTGSNTIVNQIQLANGQQFQFTSNSTHSNSGQQQFQQIHQQQQQHHNRRKTPLVTRIA